MYENSILAKDHTFSNQKSYIFGPENHTFSRLHQISAIRHRSENYRKTNKKATLHRFASWLSVEAGGIEPPSRDIFTNTSTCVAENLIFAQFVA